MTGARSCSVCGKSFEPRFRYQSERHEGGAVAYYCSQKCQHGATLQEGSSQVPCAQCGKSFVPEFAWQLVGGGASARYSCSQACSEALAQARAKAAPVAERGGPLRIAVFNHKGGTGKTTTAVNVAAGLAETGLRVLLVDLDAQGNVGVSLGVRGEKTMYHVLVLGADPREASVPVRKNIDVLTSNETLAAAELYLAGRPNRDRVLRERMQHASDYDVVLLDCSPSLSLLNQNALVYADCVLIPVSCDYLALVGVKQVIKTLRNVYEQLKHPVHILGVVPTFYDARHRINKEVVDTLTKKFGELCLPVVRNNIKLREAPAARQSIFEYAPDSHGAEDYRTIVKQIVKALKGKERGERGASVSQMEVA